MELMVVNISLHITERSSLFCTLAHTHAINKRGKFPLTNDAMCQIKTHHLAKVIKKEHFLPRSAVYLTLINKQNVPI